MRAREGRRLIVETFLRLVASLMDYLLLEHRSLARTLLYGIRETLQERAKLLESGDGDGEGS